MPDYQVQTDSGKVYTFSRDRHDLGDFSDFGSAEAHSEDFRTVTSWKVEEGIGAAFGAGQSRNPDRAEAYLYFDAQNTTPAAISGRFRIVVLNSANDVVGEISRGRLEEVRNGDPSTDSRGDWGIPYPYQRIRGASGEVIGGDGYKVAIQIQTDSGTETFSTSNSTLVAEGYRGTVQN